MAGDLPIGRQVAYWRVRRRLSQQVFADRLGKSKSWVDKVERGVRTLDKVSVLQEIAVVLRIDLAALIGVREAEGPPAAVHGEIHAGLDGLRAALAVYQVPLARPDAPTPPIDGLRDQVRHVRSTYDYGRYGILLRHLGRLIGPAQRAHAADPEEAAGLLVDVYRLAAAVLVKLDEGQAAWLAADRAMATAAGTGRRGLVAAAAVSLTQALRSAGRPVQAMQAGITGAHHVAGDDAGDEDVALSGLLLAEAGLAAATAGDTGSAYELLDQATEIAEQVPMQGWLSPAAAATIRVAAGVALGDERALRWAAEVPTIHGWRWLTPEHRAAHLVDVARGYLHAGELDAAGRLLVDAYQIAPGEALSRPAVRAVITEVARLQGGRAPAVRLAERVGVR